MYSTIPKSWRDDFGPNTTIQELNDALVILHIPAITLFAVLMLVGIIGNLLVLCIYSRFPKSFVRVFILWLGVIDLIACCVASPLLIVSMLNPYQFPSASICQIVRFLHVFLVISSVFIFMFISVERHRAICKMERVEMNDRRVHIVCFLCCIVGVLVSVPAIFVYGERTVNTGVNNITGNECFVNDNVGDLFLPKAYFIFQLLLWLVSLLVMVVLYVRIGLQLNWHLKFSRLASASFRRSANRKYSSDAVVSLNTTVHKESKVDRYVREITEMLCIITVVFVLSFLPHLILLVLNSVNDDFLYSMSPAGIAVYNIFLRSFVINNMANPVIYLVYQQDFRRDCSKLLKNICTCCRLKI